MASRGLISRDGAVLVVIDVQEKLFPSIYNGEEILKNIIRMIEFAKIINMPIILTEQYPKGLGATISEIKRIIPDIQPIEKIEFSCFGSEKFRETLKRLNARTLIIVGIETHICIAQTAIEGAENGYRICIISDATSSRNPEDKKTAIERVGRNGVIIASTEMLIYELLRRAGTKEFRESLRLIKLQ